MANIAQTGAGAQQKKASRGAPKPGTQEGQENTSDAKAIRRPVGIRAPQKRRQRLDSKGTINGVESKAWFGS